MNSSSDIYGAQRVNLVEFSDPLTFPPVSLAGQSFHISCEISNQDGLA